MALGLRVKWTLLFWLYIVLQLRMLNAQLPVNDCDSCTKQELGCLHLYNTDTPNNPEVGVVQICVQNPYVRDVFDFAVVCYFDSDLFNNGSAAAACRQKLYITYHDFGNARSSRFDLQIPPSQLFIRSIQCPYMKDYSFEGELNLLRCAHTPVTNESCTSSPDGPFVAVSCNDTYINAQNFSYNGQVSINATTLTTGKTENLVHIRLDKTSLPLCVNDYNDNSFDSICRQLGYTKHVGTVNPTSPNEIGRSWYLGNISCPISYSCFTNCFNTKNYMMVSTCNHYGFFELQCIYNDTDSAVYGSGSKGLCEIHTSCTTCPSKTYQDGVIIASVSFSVAIIVLVVLEIALAYIALRYCRRRGYIHIGQDGQGGQGCL